jgi:phosphomannomutase
LSSSRDETEWEVLAERARRWLSEDPDPDTRDELSGLLAARDAPALAERFAGRLAFGTAGLRAPLGGGPMRMNRVVAIRAAAGLSAYVAAHGGGAVVIGHDARHKSRDFASDTAEIARGAGLPALLFDRPVPTPVLAFAIRHLGAAAGVMVTASHNPAQDNGYKVYLGDGSQIIPPADAEIAQAIDAVGPLPRLPRGTDWTPIGDDVLRAYLDRAAAVVAPRTPRDVRLAYTPLHGVGGEVFARALEQAGFAAAAVTPGQAAPDPGFPTLAFPNPEEPGVLDLGIATAREHDADLLIAHDPDADRCAVAVPDPAAGGWRMLSGDELGVLLAVGLLRRDRELTGTLASSIVSSSLLGRIAAAYGVVHVETLTGFKWISRVPDLRYGYEEALGYCADPGAVRDKDGLTAGLLAAELAATLKAEGRTVVDLLDEIAREHGLHATAQLALRVPDAAVIREAMARLRSRPPRALGGRAITSIDDLEQEGGRLPPTPGLRMWLAAGARVIVRPSGTEPKLKSYLEVVEDVAGTDVSSARRRADATLAAVRADLRRTLDLG